MNTQHTTAPRLPKPSKEYDLYLFDADGTLFNTVELVTESYIQVFDQYPQLLTGGRRPSRRDVSSLMGIPLQAQMREYFGDLNYEQMDAVCNAYSEFQKTIYKDHLKLFPGVLKTLNKLKAAGKQCGIVTSRRRESAALYAEDTGVMKYMDILITPEDTGKHKPDPEPVIEAMKRLGTTADRTVFIGDALFDIQSGDRAGVDTVFVSWSHNDPDQLETRPTYIIDQMDELLCFSRVL